LILNKTIKQQAITYPGKVGENRREMTTMNQIIPKLEYSTYIPQQADIENNIQQNIQISLTSERNNFNEEVKILKNRMNSLDKKMEEIEKNFYSNIKCRLLDSVLGIVLFIIIYVKVYS
jgi:hypothetical protein